MKTSTVCRRDNDTPWKQGIESLFQPFVKFCYPNIAGVIDWDQPIKNLDKELLKDRPDQSVKKHIPDKLFEVSLKDQMLPSLYVHVEIQCQKESTFAKRMFWYNTQIMKKFDQPVVSIALLADMDTNWGPSSYSVGSFGCQVKLNFLNVKLLNFMDQRQQTKLLHSDNAFSGLVLTYLAYVKTKENPDAMLDRKITLTKLYMEKNWTQKELAGVMRFVQWMLVLPHTHELKYQQAIRQESMMQLHFLEEEGMQKGMLIGRQEGLHDGRAEVLRRLLVKRFNLKLTEDHEATLARASIEELDDWTDKLFTVESIDELLSN